MPDLPLHRHDRDIENFWARARIDALLAAGARTILDVGCVDGFVLDAYPQAMGLDQRGPRTESTANRVMLADIASPHFAADGTMFGHGPWDIVTCISTIEHVGLGFYGDPTAHGDHGPALAFRSLVRLTAPGGHILLTVPIGLTRQEGAGAARYWTIDDGEVWGWAKMAGVEIIEWLVVVASTWTGYPDPADRHRRVLLAVLKKKEA